MPADQLAATIANIIIAVVGILSLAFYGAHSYLSTCGWEEVYVCVVELMKVFIEIFLEYCVPVTFYETNGNFIVWVRYAEWLLTCPVILIRLSNLTGLADDYNKRTMSLLVSDIGTIVMGVTAAIASGYVKLAFFLLGLCYGCVTFKLAGQIHLEAFYSMPRGKCRRLVKWMALVFYTSWLGYPVLFVLGTEGFFRVLSPWGSVVGHCIVDLLSKNLWGFLGHHLRIHVETFVEDDSLPGAVRSSMAGVARRKSIQKARSNLTAKGQHCCELDLTSPAAAITPKSPHPSTPGNQPANADDDDEIEYILPAQFLLGNPRWHSSLAGSVRRVHPAAAAEGSAADAPKTD
ncbi:hypothetical protein OEZ85_010879 [Tetradesmus obliquus]|uniref:Uncharacterized protein n=1 Tax=Tetradesmus obliquus TaxID=3088 RepID=A0ABY8TPA0_TETOB|nr:hypothetical protein OEZ85_010879 [Tetradesmus obliquus]